MSLTDILLSPRISSALGYAATGAIGLAGYHKTFNEALKPGAIDHVKLRRGSCLLMAPVGFSIIQQSFMSGRTWGQAPYLAADNVTVLFTHVYTMVIAAGASSIIAGLCIHFKTPTSVEMNKHYERLAVGFQFFMAGAFTHISSLILAASSH